MRSQKQALLHNRSRRRVETKAPLDRPCLVVQMGEPPALAPSWSVCRQQRLQLLQHTRLEHPNILFHRAVLIHGEKCCIVWVLCFRECDNPCPLYSPKTVDCTLLKARPLRVMRSYSSAHWVLRSGRTPASDYEHREISGWLKDLFRKANAFSPSCG